MLAYKLYKYTREREVSQIKPANYTVLTGEVNRTRLNKIIYEMCIRLIYILACEFHYILTEEVNRTRLNNMRHA